MGVHAALPANIILGRKCLLGTNTLAYLCESDTEKVLWDWSLPFRQTASPLHVTQFCRPQFGQSRGPEKFFFLLLSLSTNFRKKLHRIAREMAQSCTEKLQNRAKSARSAAKNTEPVFLIFINFFAKTAEQSICHFRSIRCQCFEKKISIDWNKLVCFPS
jgi:hypothetical protein